MKQFIFSVLSVFMVSISFAQLSYTQQQDTGGFESKRILIIPYEPKMHLSDADNMIAEYSEKNPQQVRMMFRTGITNQLQATLVKVYPTHSMLANLTPEGMKALDDVYRYVDYSYDTVYAALHPVAKEKVRRGENDKAKNENDADDLRYMNVKLVNDGLITKLCRKFDANVVVFLSQVEIKTMYADCLDASLNIYPRAIKVHYSVFEESGRQVYGGIAKLSLPSSSNEIGEIMAQSFPDLSGQIKESVAGEQKILSQK